MSTDESKQFVPLNIAVLTISDTRSLADDKSGTTLAERIVAAGHKLAGREIVADDVDAIRIFVKKWIGGPLVDAADGKSTQSLPQIAAEGVIGHLAARNSDDREGVRQKTPGSKIVKRRHEETVGGISQSAENEQAARAGRRSPGILFIMGQPQASA